MIKFVEGSVENSQTLNGLTFIVHKQISQLERSNKDI